MSASLGASTLRRAMALYGKALADHRDEIDSLNVYPVPDGDTGTNLLLTQESVLAAIAAVGAEDDAPSLTAAIARSALLGARGNSGVILSQVLQALCERVPPGGGLQGPDLAEALGRASDQAWRAVHEPAEGTVLTVLREAAAAASAAAGSGDGRIPVSPSTAADVAAAALSAARTALERTRDGLPEMRAAGVVDAGGKGIVLLFDALHAALSGMPMTEPIGPPGPVGRAGPGSGAGGGGFAYEVQYLLEADQRDEGRVKAALQGVGDSLTVAGLGGTFRVHVHTDQPERAVEAGAAVGRPRQISIAPLAVEGSQCADAPAQAPHPADRRCAMVAVAEGAGLAATFGSLGAVVVPGGPGHNPSVNELLEAIGSSAGAAVIVLPNHPNVVPAAEMAAAQASRPVRVVRAMSIPAGVAAAAAFNPLAPEDRNVAEMEAAATATRSGAMARAQRDAHTPSGPVRAGQWLGMVDGRAIAIGDQAATVAVAVGRRLVFPTAETLSLITGEAAEPYEVEGLTTALNGAFPRLEVQVLRGGQPHYPYLIGVE